MSEITEFTSRTLDQEIDTLEIIPEHPNYVIVGTYNLHKKDASVNNENAETASTGVPASRSGSLQILPFDADAEPEAGRDPLVLDRKDFPCAIVDLHFHPVDRSLFAAATSTAEVRFFRVVREVSTEEKCSKLAIVELGVAVTSEADETGDLPLVTYFRWLPELRVGCDVNGVESVAASLVTTDSRGISKLVHTRIPREKDKSYSPLQSDQSRLANVLEVKTMDIHHTTYDMESWFVEVIPLPLTKSTLTSSSDTRTDISDYLILSGGDDGILLASQIDLNSTSSSSTSTTDQFSTAEQPSLKTEQKEEEKEIQLINHFANKRIHTAGIISIFSLHQLNHHVNSNPDSSSSSHTPLPPESLQTTNETMILTGSYDDNIRLLKLTNLPNHHASSTTTTSSRVPNLTPITVQEMNSLKLDGSPWRIIPITTYILSPSPNPEPKPHTNQQKQTNTETHYLFLICCMYAGSAIIRLIHSSTNPKSTNPQLSKPKDEWTFKQETEFTKGHKSMVYAGAVRPFFPSSNDQNCDVSRDERESRDQHEKKGGKEWKILTTSFYDLRMCNYFWTDAVFPSNGHFI